MSRISASEQIDLHSHPIKARIYYMLGLLWGTALAWAEAFSSNHKLSRLTFESLLAQFRSVFDHHLSKAWAWLSNLHQGPVTDCPVEFWTLAADADGMRRHCEGCSSGVLTSP